MIITITLVYIQYLDCWQVLSLRLAQAQAMPFERQQKKHVIFYFI